jgi:hypothetical protein
VFLSNIIYGLAGYVCTLSLLGVVMIQVVFETDNSNLGLLFNMEVLHNVTHVDLIAAKTQGEPEARAGTQYGDVAVSLEGVSCSHDPHSR